LVGDDGWLRGKGHGIVAEDGDEVAKDCAARGVGGLDGGGRGVGGGDFEVGDDLDELEEVVDGDDGVEEHEEALGQFERVAHVALRLGLEISHSASRQS
jgi:hypothetical protein